MNIYQTRNGHFQKEISRIPLILCEIRFIYIDVWGFIIFKYISKNAGWMDQSGTRV